jgi:hypothetical protein
MRLRLAVDDWRSVRPIEYGLVFIAAPTIGGRQSDIARNPQQLPLV